MGTWNKILNHYGGINAVARRFNYTSTVPVYLWKDRGIPYKIILDIHTETGIPIEKLRRRPLIKPV